MTYAYADVLYVIYVLSHMYVLLWGARAPPQWTVGPLGLSQTTKDEDCRCRGTLVWMVVRVSLLVGTRTQPN